MSFLVGQLSRGVLPIALLVLASGCSTKASVQVSRDSEADFSQFATWRWLETEREDERPRNDRERKLGEAVLRQIARELSARGFRYRATNADLGIGARLVIEREKRIANSSSAIETLPTFDNSPAWEIQATRSEVTHCERGRVTIHAMDLRQDRDIWRADYVGPCRDAFAPHLNDAISRTLESFPSAPVEAPHSLALNAEPAEVDSDRPHEPVRPGS